MIEVVQLKEATQQYVNELIALGRELHSDQREMSLDELKEFASDDSAILMTVKDGGHIVGMASLYIIPKVGSRNGLLEDVIISSNYRGQGLGGKLIRTLIEEAKKRKIRSITLTSRPVPERAVAHKLYEKLGFEKKKTDVFKLSL